MTPNFFLIHGSFSSPFSNWLPWLHQELVDRDYEVYTPDFPSGVGYQNYQNWSKLLETYLDAGLLTAETTIYAHSIAPAFVCKFLIEHQLKVKKCVFVCGFNSYLGIDEEYDNVNRSMYLDNISDVKQFCNDIVCFYTENDPYVAYEVEKSFADAVATKQVVIKDGGHLNSESGYQEFPQLLEVL